LETDLQAELSRRARVSGSAQVYPSPEFQAILAAAVKEGEKLKDDELGALADYLISLQPKTSGSEW
ncbi:MAG: hypothetical protein AAB339_13030, partial [Elusimicrobiota bacterium]